MDLIPDEVLWRTKKCLGDAIADQEKFWFDTFEVQEFFEAQVKHILLIFNLASFVSFT